MGLVRSVVGLGSRLICLEVVSGMGRESGKRKSAEVFRESEKVRKSNESR